MCSLVSGYTITLHILVCDVDTSSVSFHQGSGKRHWITADKITARKRCDYLPDLALLEIDKSARETSRAIDPVQLSLLYSYRVKRTSSIALNSEFVP